MGQSVLNPYGMYGFEPVRLLLQWFLCVLRHSGKLLSREASAAAVSVWTALVRRVLSVFLSICLSVCESPYLSAFLSAYLWVCPRVRVPVCLSVFLCVRLCVCVYACVCVYVCFRHSLILSLSFCFSVLCLSR